MTAADPWHYPRTALADQLLALFQQGLATSLVFFAPRRMGKTEFLCKDIQPLAQKKGWFAFYFSFLDVGEQPATAFTNALLIAAQKNKVLTPSNKLLKYIKKITASAVGIKGDIEFQIAENKPFDLKSVLAELSKKHKVLLLLDEIQVLALQKSNTQFIAALRTALDIYKDRVKVIFTGSSREGLRKMFSSANAPFFHFGQNLPFPNLERAFTDHLALQFKKITHRTLDEDALWNSFVALQHVPQLMRSLVERIAFNPNLTISAAQKELLTALSEDRNYKVRYQDCTTLEQLLLQHIARKTTLLFSDEIRKHLAQQLGVKSIAISSIQSAIRTLLKKELIGRTTTRGNYFIEDSNLQNWLLTQK